MTARAVSELIEIGPPEGWPHGRHSTRAIGPAQLRGAKIASVSTKGDEVTIGVDGPSMGGATLSTFVIRDAELRKRIVRAVRPGMDVYDAAAQEI